MLFLNLLAAQVLALGLLQSLSHHQLPAGDQGQQLHGLLPSHALKPPPNLGQLSLVSVLIIIIPQNASCHMLYNFEVVTLSFVIAARPTKPPVQSSASSLHSTVFWLVTSITAVMAINL